MYGLIANVVSDHALRHGTKVRILSAHDDAMNVEVIGLSKGGRRITKYIQWKRLTNIRASFLAECYRKDTCLWWTDKKAACDVAVELMQLWKDVQVLHPDGTVLQKGITTGEAFARQKLRMSGTDRGISPIPPIKDRIKEMAVEKNSRSYRNSASD